MTTAEGAARRTPPARGRLLGLLPGGRGHVLAFAAGSTVTAVLIVAQADLLAALLAGGFAGAAPAWPLIAALAAVVCVRAALWFGLEALARRAADAVKARLRTELLDRAQRGGPGWLAGRRRGELVTLATRGLDALDPYVTGYLPALVPAVVVPVAILIRLTAADWGSALIILLTLPLIPVFGALVGAHTRDATLRQWRSLERLGGHFADVVAGLPTLRVFGRARAQAEVVRRIADAHRGATMRTLRIAFLSALVLELVASVSVALVAVPVGLRLLDGQLTLHVALLVLILAPEAYLPLRALGTRFHASAEGLAVAERAFGVIDDETRVAAAPGAAGPPPGARAGGAPAVRLEGVTVRYPGRDRPALAEVSLEIRPGERVALVGPSGAGKSTLLALVLGFARADSGRVLLGGADAAAFTDADWARWRAGLGWIGQRPHLFAGTLAENIALAEPSAPSDAVEAAARAARVDAFAAELPEGYATRLGERGAGLSAGQRQRVALARAVLRDPPLLLLDEPTAHLDGRSEAAVLAATSALLTGRTAVLVTHRPALLAHADRVVTLRDGRIAAARATGSADD
ncbi:thiol reductant ABC exporter subunit CydD [Allonocardiopsis opalescens]|uniref:ATP-binding cassette subfamily C protein CydD n=1 Tax=Allonocardiopsis opalescens TaxID=1144618 RepID=A0A2T0QDR1_9ACTN|nr:thiol reductant ABC exporter subunit CydD [Allonocardiopsis opalescens]PRY02010.1 ATP-binding cassette subfamily C protein CydD [Allonocardiopsis opalescens]